MFQIERGPTVSFVNTLVTFSASRCASTRRFFFAGAAAGLLPATARGALAWWKSRRVVYSPGRSLRRQHALVGPMSKVADPGRPLPWNTNFNPRPALAPTTATRIAAHNNSAARLVLRIS